MAGLNPMVGGRRILKTADRVPVGSYPEDAAAHLVFLFSAWGLNTFMLGLLALVILIRYRSMIPLMYVLLLIEQAGRKRLAVVHLDKPFFSAELAPANIINSAFLAMMIIGLALSLARPRSKT